jgi:adenylate kinase family enzyme
MNELVLRGSRFAILGNSGSGKSTWARTLAQRQGWPLLDLDTVAWEPGQVAVARDPRVAADEVRDYCRASGAWVVEGCYASLTQVALDSGGGDAELLFLHPGEAQCLANCRARPWEPHKYKTPAEQDSRLAFLLQWVSDYYRRDGDMSLKGHQALFDAWAGPKRLVSRQLALPD